MTADASPASAAEGYVALRSGGRAEGTIVLVVPNERVVVRLADGTLTTFAWSDVMMVTDGARVYDSTGQVTTVSGSTPSMTPANAAATAPESSGPIPGDHALLHFLSLPRRGGSIGLGVLGGLFLANGAANMIGGAVVGCTGSSSAEDCGIRNVMLGTGAVSAGLGALMTVFVARRAHTRQAGIDDLRARGYTIAENGEGPALRLSVDFSGGVGPASTSIVPRLTMRF